MCRISQYTLEASEPLVELITKPVPAVTVPILANRASFSSYFRGRGDSPFSSNHIFSRNVGKSRLCYSALNQCLWEELSRSVHRCMCGVWDRLKEKLKDASSAFLAIVSFGYLVEKLSGPNFRFLLNLINLGFSRLVRAESAGSCTSNW